MSLYTLFYEYIMMESFCKQSVESIMLIDALVIVNVIYMVLMISVITRWSMEVTY